MKDYMKHTTFYSDSSTILSQQEIESYRLESDQCLVEYLVKTVLIGDCIKYGNTIWKVFRVLDATIMVAPLVMCNVENV
ncbi:MAG: hypothetical protein QM489_00970 [Candidatus Izemoplasma sp.]